MRFVLWVAQKKNLQAYRAYSIFKYMKLKSYDKKNIHTQFLSYHLKNEKISAGVPLSKKIFSVEVWNSTSVTTLNLAMLAD